MEINPLEIAIHMVNIVVLYLLLRTLVYRPVRKFMQERAQRVQKQLDEAEQTHQQAEALKTEYQQKLAQAEAQAQRCLEEGNQKAAESAAAIVAEANLRAAGIMDTARTEASAVKEKAVEELEPEIADMAVTIAGRILGREVSERDNQELIDAFFRQQAKGA